LEFRGGDIRTLTPFDEPVGAVRIRESVLKKVSGVLIAGHDEKAGSWAQRKSFQLVLSRLLRKTADARHGGAFVFLPSSCSDFSVFDLNLQFEVSDLDLGRDLVEWHLACLSAHKESWSPHDSPKAVQAVVNAEQWRAKLMMDTDAIADLSSVDGCVVLDQELKVFGFGAKIKAQLPPDGTGHRPFFRNGELRSTNEFMGSIGGTRHQSAARICHAHHEAVVYTVSQDGGVNLFFSDAKGVHVHGPLDVPATDMDATMTT
jgi:hypothetical protein